MSVFGIFLLIIAFGAGWFLPNLIRRFGGWGGKSPEDASSPLIHPLVRESLNRIALPILQTDIHDRIVFVNDKFCEFFGFTRDEIMGREITDNIAPDLESVLSSTKPKTSASDSLTERYASLIHHINENRRKDGSSIQVAWVNVVIADSDGQLAGALSIGSDVTEWMNLSQELILRDKLLNGMIEAIHWIFSQADLGKAISLSLSSFAKAAGADRVYLWKRLEDAGRAGKFQKVHLWESARIPRNPYLPAMPNQFDDDPFEWHERLAAGLSIAGKLPEMPEEWRAGLEANHTKALVVAPITFIDGFWGFFGLEHCLEDRAWSYAERNILSVAGNIIAAGIHMRATENESRESLRGTRELGNSLKAVAWELDKDFRVVHISDEDGKILGSAPDAFIGRRLDRLLGGAVLSGIENGPVGPVFCQMKDGKGEFRSLLASSTPIFDSNRALQGVRCVTIDVSGLARARDAAAETDGTGLGAARELEEAVAKANVMAIRAESANQAKNRLVMVMGHELRAPMAGVLGALDLLMNTGLSQTQRECAENAAANARDLLATVNRILDYARLDHGEERRAAAFSLWTVADEVFAFVGPTAAKKGIGLAFLPNNDCPDILSGDPDMLRQTLLQLVSNAVKFTDRGEVLVRCRVERRDNREAMLRLSVADSGRGISPEAVERIFDPFFQEGASDSGEREGIGLGLAIAKGLVEMMGGGIGAKSEQGKGATFWFTARFGLPDARLRAEFEESRHDPANPPNDSAALKNIADFKILAVSSDETFRKALRKLARSLDCRLEATADPEKALSLLHLAASASDPFNAVLLDSRPPAADLSGLAANIKADAALAGSAVVPVVPMGTGADGQLADPGLYFGFLEKPALRSELFRLVTRIAAKKGRTAAAVRRGASATDPIPAIAVPAKREVLLVEDSRINQIVAVSNLEKLGCRADVAENGEKALEFLARKKYDLVLMDCQMPVMDGYEAAARIRKGDGGVIDPSVPIVAMTPIHDDEDRRRCLGMGMNGYISKPFTMEEIRAVINGDLSGAGG